MATAPPEAARRYYAVSAAAASKAGTAVTATRRRGFQATWKALVQFQILQATLAAGAVTAILNEQAIAAEPEVALSLAGFTTPADTFAKITRGIKADVDFRRIVESITQDAGRAAQSVSVATRENVAYVRHLNLPSCSRCAILAGRVYRWSTGFQRHPGCDCVMIPTTLANDDLTYDPVELARNGQMTGLSKADRQAVLDGADVGQVVNIRGRAAGLSESGTVLLRAGRMTPEAIYRVADGDRQRALDLLAQHGYVR